MTEVQGRYVRPADAAIAFSRIFTPSFAAQTGYRSEGAWWADAQQADFSFLLPTLATPGEIVQSGSLLAALQLIRQRYALAPCANLDGFADWYNAQAAVWQALFASADHAALTNRDKTQSFAIAVPSYAPVTGFSGFLDWVIGIVSGTQAAQAPVNPFAELGPLRFETSIDLLDAGGDLIQDVNVVVY